MTQPSRLRIGFPGKTTSRGPGSAGSAHKRWRGLDRWVRAEVTGPGLSGKDAVRPVVIVEMLKTVEDGLGASTERAAHSFGRTRNTTARLRASRRARVAAGRKLVEANGFGLTVLVELGLDLGAAIDLTASTGGASRHDLL